MKIKFYLLFCFAQWSLFTDAQQLPLFTEYHEYRTFINPGALTGDGILQQRINSITLGARNQLTGIKGSPQTFILKGDFMVNNLSVGGYLINDNFGPSQTTTLTGRLAYLITNDISQWGISGGLSMSNNWFKIDPAQISFRQSNDILATEIIKSNYTDIGLRLFAYKNLSKTQSTKHIFYGGLSLRSFFPNEDISLVGKSASRLHYFYGLFGYFWQRSENEFLEISTWSRYITLQGYQMDINCRYQWDRIWAGLGISTQLHLHGELGMYLSKYRKGWYPRLGLSVTTHPQLGLTFESTLTFLLPDK